MKNTILFKEISDQPNKLQKLIDSESKNIKAVAHSVSGHFRSIIIAARGSSDNAARYAQYLFGIRNGLQVALATPSLLTIYNATPSWKDTLVMGISQSGQSPDICAVVQEAKTQGISSIALTNDALSPLAKLADHVILLNAGEEKSIAATKTYTTSLCALALFSSYLNTDTFFEQAINSTPVILQDTIKRTISNIDDIIRYRDMEHCSVIGRGYNYSSAFEIALKIKELTGIISEPFSSADFRHGPIATVHENSPVIVIASNGKTEEDLGLLLEELDHKKAEMITITNNDRIKKHSTISFSFSSSIPELLSPLAAVIPGQLIALKLAIEKGLDPDHPFGLEKVTLTR